MADMTSRENALLSNDVALNEHLVLIYWWRSNLLVVKHELSILFKDHFCN